MDILYFFWLEPEMSNRQSLLKNECFSGKRACVTFNALHDDIFGENQIILLLVTRVFQVLGYSFFLWWLPNWLNVWLVSLGFPYIYFSGKPFPISAFPKKYTNLGHQWEKWRAHSFSQGENIFSYFYLFPRDHGKERLNLSMFNTLYPYILLRMRSKCFVMALYFSAQDVGMMWLWNPVKGKKGQHGHFR